MHHNQKVDAPSGTALMLGRAAAEGRGIDLDKQFGAQPRRPHRRAQAGDIGFATLRGGSVVGEHSVIFAGPAERIELTHKAEDRMIFARGALHAARVGAQPEAGALFDDGCAGIEGLLRTAMTDRLLVLVRHGQSEWNLKNLFTGWRDVDLTEKGVAEARAAGRKLKAQGITFDVAFTSALKRAQRTLDLMLEELGQTNIPVFKDQALNERDYGDLVGLNKDDARKKWGEEQVHIWRRSYDVAPPGGESLKDTLARALPYYIKEILPRVLRGERVLVSAHGNSLRALVMVLDKLTPDEHHQARISRPACR